MWQLLLVAPLAGTDGDSTEGQAAREEGLLFDPSPRLGEHSCSGT